MAHVLQFVFVGLFQADCLFSHLRRWRCFSTSFFYHLYICSSSSSIKYPYSLLCFFNVFGFSGSDRVGNDRHVEEEPQSIQNSLRMVSCKFMLPLFWSSLMVAWLSVQLWWPLKVNYTSHAKWYLTATLLLQQSLISAWIRFRNLGTKSKRLVIDSVMFKNWNNLEGSHMNCCGHLNPPNRASVQWKVKILKNMMRLDVYMFS